MDHMMDFSPLGRFQSAKEAATHRLCTFLELFIHLFQRLKVLLRFGKFKAASVDYFLFVLAVFSVFVAHTAVSYLASASDVLSELSW
jgi:hypothetical protein